MKTMNWCSQSRVSASVRRVLVVALGAASVAISAASGVACAADMQSGNVDLERLLAADKDAGQWLTGGRDFHANFYSPLKQINDGNVKDLGLAWEYSTNTDRGLQATPIVIDGVMYTSGVWGAVYALDAATGKQLWVFNPDVDHQYAFNAEVDVVTRGVAVWKGTVYVVSTDCYLWALDARTGKVRFKADTLGENRPGRYACSGEPRVAGDIIAVGNTGGDNGPGGTRGFVSGFDLNTGALRWRFYTVPKLNDPDPQPHLVEADKTWDPKRNPSFGGGGSVWNTMVYDPNQDLIIFGTGNAAPYNAPRNRTDHSTDSLYTASIVAVSAKTGKLAWYYQATPGDSWDYDATSPLVLADLTIDGKRRRTVLQANKNGYFYVLDRTTGKPISVTPYAYMNWSKGVDKDFRPIYNSDADYSKHPALVYPAALGAHDWSAMAFNPHTGLVYIAANDAPNILVDLAHKSDAPVKFIEGWAGVSAIYADKSYSREDNEPIVGSLPRFPQLSSKSGKPMVRGVIRAWDPVAKRVVWEQQTSQDYLVLEGGTLSTAGNLVFAGSANGKFVAYAADTGKVLKSIDTGVAISAAPMTYSVEGTQYVAVMEGFTSGYAFDGTAALHYLNQGRIVSFKLGGQDHVPLPERRAPDVLQEPPAREGTPEQIAEGFKLFQTNCSRCHAIGTPMVTPDLSHLNDGIANIDVFKTIVLRGALTAAGMPRFSDVLSIKDIQALHAYLVGEAWTAYKAQKDANASKPPQ
jgi:quinohemoprotein ethanol dehydrogenase